jgi:group I intron endonuclease
VLKSSGEEPREPGIISCLTRSKISESLKGRKDSEITRAKKSESRKGILNPFYRKGPGIKALDIAAEKAGTKIYAYETTKFNLVNNKPFLRSSIRSAAKVLPISGNTLTKKLDSGKSFKGYYYYSKPQNKVPK